VSWEPNRGKGYTPHLYKIFEELNMAFIFSGLFALFGVYFLILSNSKKHYQSLVENSDEKYADKNIKILKIGGFILLVISLLLMLSHFI
jgi:hypothetical protein